MSKTSPPYTTLLSVIMGKKTASKIQPSQRKISKEKYNMTSRGKIYITCSSPRDSTVMYASFMVAEPLHNHEGCYFPYKTPVDDKERL